MRVCLFIIVFLTACSEPSTPPDGDMHDADVDADQAGGDADADGDGWDSDVDRPDGLPPTCGDPTEHEELSPAPAIAAGPRLAIGADGHAAVWLEGAESPYDVVLAPIDASGIPGSPVTVASARPYAADPDLLWFDGAWSIFWREADDETSCESEDPCPRGLRLIRVSSDGSPILDADTLWQNARVTARPALLSTSDHTWVVMTVVDGTEQRVMVGRLAQAGVETGDLESIMPEYTARDSAPTAALVEDVVVVVAAVSLRGLAGVTLSSASAEVVGGPGLVIEEASASEPHLAARGSNLGIVYLANHQEGSRTGVYLVEIGRDLAVPYPPIEIAGGTWPHHPQIAGIGEGWGVVWYDGRADTDRDCVTIGFCRDDIYFSPVSISGAIGDSRLLSDDPNDCENPAIFSAQGTVGIAWEALRGDRRTLFFTMMSCE